MTFTTIVATALCGAFVFGHALWLLRIIYLRRAGIYPQRGRASESDIQKLVQAGYRVEAMRCHREVYKSSLRQAKGAIDLMATFK